MQQPKITSSDSISGVYLYVIGALAIFLSLIIIIITYHCCKRYHSDSKHPPIIHMTHDHVRQRSYKSVNTNSNTTTDTIDTDNEDSPPPTPSSPDAPLWVSNALAVIVCIAEYEDDSAVSPSDAHSMHRTDSNANAGMKRDYQNLHKLFGFLNFNVIPVEKEDPFWWTENDLIRFEYIN